MRKIKNVFVFLFTVDETREKKGSDSVLEIKQITEVLSGNAQTTIPILPTKVNVDVETQDSLNVNVSVEMPTAENISSSQDQVKPDKSVTEVKNNLTLKNMIAKIYFSITGGLLLCYLNARRSSFIYNSLNNRVTWIPKGYASWQIVH